MLSWNLVLCPTPEDWRAARLRYLTASDVAAVLGIHPHKRRASVLAEKAQAVLSAERRVDAMRAGHFLEQGILDWWLDDAQYRAGDAAVVSGMRCRDPEGTSLLVEHPDPSLRLAASPDGLVEYLAYGHRAHELVEIKVHGPRQWALWHELPKPKALARCAELRIREPLNLDAGEASAPVQHWVQLQTQLLCCGLPRGWVVGNCGSERKDVCFEADRAFQARIEQAARDFWAEVEDWTDGKN